MKRLSVIAIVLVASVLLAAMPALASTHYVTILDSDDQPCVGLSVVVWIEIAEGELDQYPAITNVNGKVTINPIPAEWSEADSWFVSVPVQQGWNGPWVAWQDYPSYSLVIQEDE